MRAGEVRAGRRESLWGVWWRHTRGMHEDGLTQGLGAKRHDIKGWGLGGDFSELL